MATLYHHELRDQSSDGQQDTGAGKYTKTALYCEQPWESFSRHSHFQCMWWWSSWCCYASENCMATQEEGAMRALQAGA
jgi:hypothetical protein